MKRLLLLTVVSTLAIGLVGCRCGNHFAGPAAKPVLSATTYGSPAPPAAVYVDSAATPPAAAPSSCGPGCTSCGNTLPSLSGAQGYAPVPGR